MWRLVKWARHICCWGFQMQRHKIWSWRGDREHFYGRPWWLHWLSGLMYSLCTFAKVSFKIKKAHKVTISWTTFHCWVYFVVCVWLCVSWFVWVKGAQAEQHPDIPLPGYNSNAVQQAYWEKSIIEKEKGKEEIPIPLLTGDSVDQNVIQTQYLAGNLLYFCC